MPKSEQLVLQTGNQSTGNVYQIAWPARVVSTDGRWLWIRDEGGYNESPVAGWVYCDDVLRVSEAQEYYTNQIRERDSAALHWLRGIYWESNNALAIAKIDYQKAQELNDSEQDARLDDIQIRLGRIAATMQIRNEIAPSSAASRTVWESHFLKAQAMNPRRPQLYLDWGNALSLACKCRPSSAAAAKTHSSAIAAKPSTAQADSPTVAVTAPAPLALSVETMPAPASNVESLDHCAIILETNGSLKDAADCRYQQAGVLSKDWWQVPFSRAELLLQQCYTETDVGEHEPNEPLNLKNLQSAETYFTQSIYLEPTLVDAYRDLGETLLLENMHGGDNRLEEAKQLVTKACTMSNFTQAGSLRTLAQICARNDELDRAVDLASNAAQYTFDDQDRQRYLRLWSKYRDDLDKPKRNTAVAVNGGSKLPGGFQSKGVDPTGPVGQPAPRIIPPPNFIPRPHSAFRE